MIPTLLPLSLPQLLLLRCLKVTQRTDMLLSHPRLEIMLAAGVLGNLADLGVMVYSGKGMATRSDYRDIFPSGNDGC